MEIDVLIQRAKMCLAEVGYPSADVRPMVSIWAKPGDLIGWMGVLPEDERVAAAWIRTREVMGLEVRCWGCWLIGPEGESCRYGRCAQPGGQRLPVPLHLLYPNGTTRPAPRSYQYPVIMNLDSDVA